jgi:uncharacterized membrane protein YhaH (DUF805 family)
MESTSPYSPPETDLLTGQEEFAPIKILSTKGRIGRMRYIAYTIGLSLLVYLVMMAVVTATATAASGSPDLAGTAVLAIMAVGFGAMLVISFLLTIQRSHDFNTSGWLSLVLLLPLVPLIFWFIPGTEGANRFGPPPPPNKGAGVVVVVIILFVVVSILAAIAIPAYQEYVARAAAGM